MLNISLCYPGLLYYIYLFLGLFIGLFTLSHGLHWLVTHQIPYDCLEVDLHKYISNE